ncbi:hypothetical protein [Thalassospira profundimaris]|uniref:hypothetical protein n=1 Tax=Thalassospira profundimaris TaxID=502049 RepID=UPI0011BE2F5C|nr:hypothetical protein [Thalassospira profundimaris]
MLDEVGFKRFKLVFLSLLFSYPVLMYYVYVVNPSPYKPDIGIFSLDEGKTFSDSFLDRYGRGYLWGESKLWTIGYEKYCLKDHYYGCTSSTSRFEYFLQIIDMNLSNYLMDVVLLAWTLVSFLGVFFYRKPRGLIVNMDIGAIYTWERGKLWILSIGGSYQSDDRVKSLIEANRPDQAVFVKLFLGHNPPKRKMFGIGDVINMAVLTNLNLAFKLRSLLLGRQDFSYEDLNLLNTYKWWERSIQGRKKFPSDIHDQAAAWMKRHADLSAS